VPQLKKIIAEEMNEEDYGRLDSEALQGLSEAIKIAQDVLADNRNSSNFQTTFYGMNANGKPTAS
jgi:hypothetical protein